LPSNYIPWSAPKWFIALFNYFVGLDPYRCYLTDEHPEVTKPSKMIRITLDVEVEVPEKFDTKLANMGIARSVIMERFKTEETARISSWHIVRAVDLQTRQTRPIPQRRGCKICGLGWCTLDSQQTG
jgi:hypothetical protein